MALAHLGSLARPPLGYRRWLRWGVWGVALAAALVGALIAQALLVVMLGLDPLVARLAVAGCAVAALLPGSHRQPRALIGAILIFAATFDWVVGETMVAVVGMEPWEQGHLGPLTPSTYSEWLILVWRVKMTWWAAFFAAGLALLVSSRYRSRASERPA